jgi:16S rRNA (guanine(527)-N(7))-methyltransferase RsmG
VRHLIVDTLLLLSILPEAASPLLDLGSGAGVPGLVLKLARPDWAVTLVEASRRRANFLRQAVRQLGLQGVGVAHTRAETLATERTYRKAFQTVTARAVGRLETVVALAAPFLAPEGQIVVSLGPEAAPKIGTVRTVEAPRGVGLSGPRQFLIIAASAIATAGAGRIVPRGTRRSGGSGARGREPEGRRRQDDHGGESGGRARRR